MPQNLTNKMVALLIAPKFQDDEVAQPRRFLADLGADVKCIGLQKGVCHGKGQTAIDVDALIGDVHPDQFDALIIPGGAAPEALRLNKDVLAFVKAFMQDAKPVAAICHGPQVLISAGVLRGRTLTSYAWIRDDVTNAGAKYLDQEVVIDNNLVTSRTPQDLPAFNKAIANLLGKYDSQRSPWVHATPAQVLEYAIWNEIKAMELYEGLSKKTRDKLIKAKYKYLAETERSHRDVLTEIFQKITKGQEPNPRDLGPGGSEARKAADPGEEIMHVLRFAMDAEDSAHRLYTEIAEKMTHGAAKATFRKLADEELTHKRLLESEYALRSGRDIPSAIEKEPWWSENLW